MAEVGRYSVPADRLGIVANVGRKGDVGDIARVGGYDIALSPPQCTKPSSFELGFVLRESGGVLLSHGNPHYHRR